MTTPEQAGTGTPTNGGHLVPDRRRPRPRPRANAVDLLDVALTVNGSPVTVHVPARMHLADTLRDQLGLTGTHLGCEHGVCGMCTVLVDGQAARACLLLTVQCEDADIVTVEGLGTPQSQHPLQRAFSAHHALQCGFCTPGMLCSAYDLLTTEPDGTTLPADELPEKMSGVLCRCTGYRGILAAIIDVAETYPGGIPPPRNCTPRRLLTRNTATVGVSPRVPSDSDAESPHAVPAEVTPPRGEPTTSIEVTAPVAAPLSDVWAVLNDPNQLVACLPGAELIESLDRDLHRGRATLSLGPVRLRFYGLARIVTRDPRGHHLHVLAQGTDTGGSATKAEIHLQANATDHGTTTLQARAALHLSGRVAQFGRALAGDVSQRMFQDFVASVEHAARSGQAPPEVGPVGHLRLGAPVLIDALRRRWARFAARLRSGRDRGISPGALARYFRQRRTSRESDPHRRRTRFRH